MRVQQIPKKLLGEVVDVYVPAGGEYGGEFSDDPVRINGVCIQPSAAFNPRSYALMDGVSAVMFVDVVNSLNAFKIPVGSIVDWEGEKMMAVSVSELRAGGTVHHWEVQLR